mgnify:CR=1 FL=1
MNTTLYQIPSIQPVENNCFVNLGKWEHEPLYIWYHVLSGVWFFIFVGNITRKVWVCFLQRTDDIFNGTCLHIKDLPHLVCGWYAIIRPRCHRVCRPCSATTVEVCNEGLGYCTTYFGNEDQSALWSMTIVSLSGRLHPKSLRALQHVVSSICFDSTPN